MKFEFLCLKWVVIEKFYDYLYGNKFKVKIDNNLLMYILIIVKLDVMGQRWVLVLLVFDFEIFYKLGKKNVDVDVLLRYLFVEKNISLKEIQVVYGKRQVSIYIINMVEIIEFLDIVEIIDFLG